MGKTIMWGACLLLSSLLTGCSLFGDQHVINLSIQTEETTYEVKEDHPLDISYTYHNQGPNSVYPRRRLGVPRGYTTSKRVGYVQHDHVGRLCNRVERPIDAGDGPMVT